VSYPLQEIWSELDDDESSHLWMAEKMFAGPLMEENDSWAVTCGCKKKKKKEYMHKAKGQFPGLKRRRMLGMVKIPNSQLEKHSQEPSSKNLENGVVTIVRPHKEFQLTSADGESIGSVLLAFDKIKCPSVKISDVIGLVPQRSLLASAVGTMRVYCQVLPNYLMLQKSYR
jgi:hypothetical protein